MYNFDQEINRRGTNCVKWDKIDKDVIPLWIADMDFACLPEVTEAISYRASHPVYGYSFASEKTYQLIVDWYKTSHNVCIKPNEIVLNTGVVYSLYQIISLFVNSDEKIIIQPDDGAFIGLLGGQDFRAVDITVVGKQNIPGLELIGTSFDDIIDISGQEQINFIKGMLVKINHRRKFVTIMVVFIKVVRHDLAMCKIFLVHVPQISS